MNRARKLFGAVALTTALALTAACGASSDDGSGATNAKNVKLRMTVWTSNQDQLELFDTIAAAYRAKHPEVSSITFESLPFEDYNTTLTTQIAGGNAPDMAWMGDLSRDLIASDALVGLTDKLKATDGWQYDDLEASATKEFSRDGTLYAYPFSTSPFALYVNTDLLAKAKQKIDPKTLTWDQVAAAGAAVHSTTGKAGFVVRDFDYKAWNTLATVWTGFGAAAWSPDGKKCTFTSPEMEQAFTFLHDAAFKTEAMPGPGTTADFFAGDAAFTVAQVSRSSLLTDKFKYALYPLPAGPAGRAGRHRPGRGGRPRHQQAPGSGHGLPRLPDESGELGEAGAVLPAAAQVAADRCQARRRQQGADRRAAAGGRGRPAAERRHPAQPHQSR